MDDMSNDHGLRAGDTAPGDDGDRGIAQSLRGYLIGLAFAAVLTATSFYIAQSNLIWAPGIPVALLVLAVAQTGVHLVFFLRITTGPEQTNNILALAFGALIVILVVGGSLWIMANLNYNMMSMEEIVRMQR